jgi:hypothetical protein
MYYSSHQRNTKNTCRLKKGDIATVASTRENRLADYSLTMTKKVAAASRRQRKEEPTLRMARSMLQVTTGPELLRPCIGAPIQTQIHAHAVVVLIANAVHRVQRPLMATLSDRDREPSLAMAFRTAT